MVTEHSIRVEKYENRWHVSVFGGKGFVRQGNLYQQLNLYKSFATKKKAQDYAGKLKQKFKR